MCTGNPNAVLTNRKIRRIHAVLANKIIICIYLCFGVFMSRFESDQRRLTLLVIECVCLPGAGRGVSKTKTQKRRPRTNTPWTKTKTPSTKTKTPLTKTKIPWTFRFLWKYFACFKPLWKCLRWWRRQFYLNWSFLQDQGERAFLALW